MPGTVLKVCGGWVVVGGGWWWLRPILVFSLSLDQAEQFLDSILTYEVIPMLKTSSSLNVYFDFSAIL